MASANIELPEFNFASFYYPDILEALIAFKRLNVPELTDESEFEPFTQLLRAFALVGHLNNTLVDLVANESTLPTAQLVESVRNMLRLIDFELSPATPSQVEILYELSRTFSSSTSVVPLGARTATRRTQDDDAISVEANESLTVARTDQLASAASEEIGAFADRTAGLVSLLAVDDFAPWLSPDIRDAMYFGHSEVMWDKLNVVITTPSVDVVGVWEFYDGDWLKGAPDLATPAGASIVVNLNGLLGTTSRAGTDVRVTLNATGAFENAISQWDGFNNFVTIGLLGQTSPSAIEADYSVGSDWTIFDDVVDGTAGFTASGDVDYGVPQTVAKNWATTTVNGVAGFFIRFRITFIGGAPVSPVLNTANINTGKQYVIRGATQGVTAQDAPLGSSTGLPDQRFEMSRDNFITASEIVEVDGVEWTRVSDFLNSAPTDEHYRIELGENDRATAVFGSGAAGKIPPIGSGNVSVTYRFGAQDDGNVGPGTLIVDKTGLTFVNSVTNPRQASGWQQADGADTASLEMAKVRGPASLRAQEVALGPDDVVTLAKAFTDSQGSRLYTRALAIEEGLGPKTIELVVVLAGGGLASTAQLEALATHFNGDKFAIPALPKRIVANQEVTAFNHTPRPIDITATVTTTATEQEIKNRLQQIMRPEALKEDGVTFEWEFGGDVPMSRIIHEIFKADESTTKKVDLASPAVDVVLGARELPSNGVFTITVVAP